ncbi:MULTISPECIES: hypothetical protein [Vibrio]|uniref:hypothetical protein n=1 Tax=Vibrio TaxID=662 RepID=UPI00215E15C2|nr:MULTISPECIES: hypothetical protein [Vibrio]MCS0179988.1 hypothetical protein [Vibrio alginolyticus]MDW3155069.1 hypothetical protein [Vibrio sp. 779(2023)]
MKKINCILLTSLLFGASLSAGEFYCSDFSGEQRFKVHGLTGIVEALSPNNILENINADKVSSVPSEDAVTIKSTFNSEVHTLNIHSSGMNDGKFLFNFHGNVNLYGNCTKSN